MSAPTDVAEILVVDDDTLVLRALSATLKRHFRVLLADSGARALEVLAAHPGIAVAIIDQRMPGMTGPELIRSMADPYPDTVRIILTGYQDIRSLKEAINNGGAYRYLEKPCDNEELIEAVRGAVDLHSRLLAGRREPEILDAANRELAAANQRLALENSHWRHKAYDTHAYDGRIVGSSPALQQVLKEAERIAVTEATVLILGETGTGKDLLARRIHDRSLRRDNVFRAQNCGAVAESMMEDMLFGHTAGAFTGARSLKKGLFEVADGGTLFLDEIGDCSPSLQARLLRVVEDSVVHRLGDDETALPVNVRLVAATNRDLHEEVEEGRFRKDLYYRLSVLTLKLPPLRERRGDIRELASYFIARFNERARQLSGKLVGEIGADGFAVLESYDYPGNVRELATILERCWVYADDGESITADHVRASLDRDALPEDDSDPADASAESLRTAVQVFKKQFIAAALDEHGWNVAATARALGISRGRLYAEMKECELARP